MIVASRIEEIAMRGVRYVYLGIGVAVAVAGLVISPVGADNKSKPGPLVAPTFKVDPFWPQPLPDNWVTGEVGGTCIDSRDHLFIVTRGFQNGGLVSPEGLGGADTQTGTLGGMFKSKASPPVIEFDPSGKVVNSWGNPALMPAGTIGPAGNNIGGQNAVLPNGIHGCFVDYQDNVWIGGNGDGVVQKYSHDGTLLLQIGTKFLCDRPDLPGGTGPCALGTPPQTGTSHTLLNLPADIAVDPANGEVYIADGYGNHRVVVFDKNGNYLRQMGGTGSGDGQFTAGDGGHPHCVVLPRNGYVYACDRGQDRINIYSKGSGTTPGTFVKAMPIVPGTNAAVGANGSAWDVDFSPDVMQTFMYESDGSNEIMWIMDHAAALNGNPPAGVPNPAILGGFGRPGHMAGDFTFLHMMAIDSKGNLYAGETVGGRRVQKFTHVCPGNSQGHGNADPSECPGNSGGH